MILTRYITRNIPFAISHISLQFVELSFSTDHKLFLRCNQHFWLPKHEVIAINISSLLKLQTSTILQTEQSLFIQNERFFSQ